MFAFFKKIVVCAVAIMFYDITSTNNKMIHLKKSYHQLNEGMILLFTKS